MEDTLIIFSSVDGQTEKIANFIKSSSKRQEGIKIVSIKNIRFENLNEYKNIILGASIRYGKHCKKVYSFVSENKSLLDKKNTAFFSVNVVARKPDKNTAETNPYIKKFLSQTKWTPKKQAVFAGKVDYPNYRIFDKYIIRFIMFITKGPTDITQSYEFTDWSKIKQFSVEIENFS
tara:strand:- start:12 stop:539 length:528 start_codon:yes stop_codon:yes gene_type:complete